MLIQEKEKTCPYTGLRSFTEEESVYFRGRDEQIEKSTIQLGRNKFLMVTGASGDGKSSIIYAGMIPYLKAGFLKTEYTRWATVDFRPERDPFGNFARALSKYFDNISLTTLRTELNRGFSSLVMLYKNSPLYVDKNRKEWLSASDSEKKSMRRDAANLFILVDQFEEFFTNPENYRQGIASEEASLVVSTLLETARLASKENLPIYIVFTMRSDYIGQCVTFRGLPEFIGYSQFFIPRLNREEIKMVIREPAELGGYEITDRLVERLLYDLEEGIDQLPILQHTLSRIWHFAIQRNETMDLLHYAMAGGISAEELLAEDQAIFNNYKASLSKEIQKGFRRASLRNVLDLHANSLYSEAHSVASDVDQRSISIIIQATFKCLTKIDEDRAVRNRMTLREITHIINRPEITMLHVAAVLRVFREPGTTFLKPYIDNDYEETVSLSPDDVLDITHESLIRNWRNLEVWARQEHSHYRIYQELRNHLDHWVSNNYSSNFLLAVGTLNYFEQWKDEINPNPHWINRYEKIRNPTTSVSESDSLLSQINSFLKKSAWKNLISRMVLRYGMQNIVTGLVTAFLIISCVIFFSISRTNTNLGVVQKVKKEGIRLLSSSVVTNEEKGIFLIALYREDSSAFYKTMQGIKNPADKLELYQSIMSDLDAANPDFHGEFMQYVFGECKKEAEALRDNIKSDKDRVVLLEHLHTIMLVAHGKSHLGDGLIFEQYATHLASLAYNELLEILATPESFNSTELDQKYIHSIVDVLINTRSITTEQADQLLAKISVLEDPSNKEYEFYSSSYPILIIENDEDLKKGIFQLLGHLYSFKGDVKKAEQCFDSLLAHNRNYYAPGDPTVPPYLNPFTLSINFLLNGFDDEYSEFNNYVANKVKIPRHKFYLDAIDMACYRWDSRQTWLEWGKGYRNLSLDDFDRIYLRKLYSLAMNEVEKADLIPDEKNFIKARLYKNLGLHISKRSIDKEIPIDTAEVYQYFDSAFVSFNRTSRSFLEKASDFQDFDLSKNNWGIIKVSNYQLFLRPDFYKSYMFGRYFEFSSELFFRYIFEKHLTTLYRDMEGSRILGLWFMQLEDYQVWRPKSDRVKYDFYDKMSQLVFETESDTSILYPSLLRLVAANWSYNPLGNDPKAKVTERDINKLLYAYQHGPRWLTPLDNILLHHLKIFFSKEANIAMFGSVSLSRDYNYKDYQLVKTMLSVPQEIYSEQLFDNYFSAVDSAYALLDEFRRNTKEQNNNPELEVLESLLCIDDYKMNQIAFNIIKESNDQYDKVVAIRKQITSIMASGDYYKAVNSIPGTLSPTYSMIFYRRVLNDFREKRDKDLPVDGEWKVFDDAYKTSRFL